MSGGMFLVGLRDVTSSGKVIKIKSLLKEDLDIDNVKVDNTSDDETTSRLLSHSDMCPVLQNIFLYQMTAGK